MKPVFQENVNVVGGLLQKLLDRIPETGGRDVWNAIEFEVMEMDGRRISRVLAKKRHDL